MNGERKKVKVNKKIHIKSTKEHQGLLLRRDGVKDA